MFKVDTPEGEKYLVQLVGPASYRMGGQITYRGSTLTVTKKTRDYLVRKTNGAWADFDPTPEEPIQEVMPPQFGEPGGPAIDMGDIDPEANPPLSMDHARALAMRTGNIPDAAPEAPDMADLSQKAAPPVTAPEGRGDMTSADLATTPPKGGKTASTPRKGGVTVGSKKAETPAKDAEAVTVD
jgi:hypothetical protein